jgi:lipopolysaccharide/colanic/teichoic acid biosynthesis glycosyltransferase
MWRGKRLFDFWWSMLGLAVLAPLLFLIALLVKAADGGPVFFRQIRVGYRGRPFRIWKFRTMVDQVASRGAELTIGNDPRVTRTGAWLRRFKLDELPQLLNVVVGEMSLVGPRPEVPCYVAQYTTEQRRVLDLTPGITGIASIRYSNESEILGRAADPERTYVEAIMPDKIRLGLAYAARATMWTDFRVVVATLRGLIPSLVATPSDEAAPALRQTRDRG